MRTLGLENGQVLRLRASRRPGTRFAALGACGEHKRRIRAGFGQVSLTRGARNLGFDRLAALICFL